MTQRIQSSMFQRSVLRSAPTECSTWDPYGAMAAERRTVSSGRARLAARRRYAGYQDRCTGAIACNGAVRTVNTVSI